VNKTALSAGAWRSPISTALVAGQSIRFGEIVVDGKDIYWVESRPAESGRSVIVRCDSSGNLSDMIAAPFSARSRVQSTNMAAVRSQFMKALSSSRILQTNGSTGRGAIGPLHP